MYLKLRALTVKKLRKLKDKAVSFYLNNKIRMPKLAFEAALGIYFYGMLINSVRRGIKSTFGGIDIPLLELNPLKNLLALCSKESFFTALALFILYCVITKKGFEKLSGYKSVHDKRGFDILPDGTHGTSGFMSAAEQKAAISTGKIHQLSGTLLGRLADDGDYICLKRDIGLNEHTLVYGASGAGKSRGYVKPFILQAAKRRESIILTDPKGEFFESTSEYLRNNGYTVKVFNLLDMRHSDAWNPLNDVAKDKNLVQSIANVIIENTSNARESKDFWSKGEINLLMALLHYVNSLTGSGGNLLPIEQRSLGTVYRMLSGKNGSFNELMSKMDALPDDHPAKAPYGLFRLAGNQMWSNIAVGLGNRLNVFQNVLVDKITAFSEIDLTLPGQKPCAYYCVISDSDSSLEFLSSLFFTLLFSRLNDYARQKGKNGRLPVTVNVCMDEFANCGKLLDFKKVISTVRSRGINCQLVIQSIAQLADRYEKHEWEEIISNCDVQLFLGCNDKMTADYISEKCGKVTIRVENNQQAVKPFGAFLTPTRITSRTHSNFMRPLMYPDEIMRLDNRRCLVLLRGQKPLELCKIIPEEHPDFSRLSGTKTSNYTPRWRCCEKQSAVSDNSEADSSEPVNERQIQSPNPRQNKPKNRSHKNDTNLKYSDFNYEIHQIEMEEYLYESKNIE